MSKPLACRTTIKPATPVATDPAALERRKTISRLRRAKQGLEAFLFRLDALHADKSGAYRMAYPGTPLLSDEADGKLKSIARTKREAETGCELCAAWISETADLRERIEVLRNTKLPEKDPDYNGPCVMPIHAHRAGKARPRSCFPSLDPAEVVAAHQAQRLERKARGTAFLQEFLADIEEAAEAKAAANVPH
ncbi:hypothetical protein DT603_08140 [Pseudoxanthomonas gei]|uniref:Uncharacterized protein n=1 Tax=Pseudoxanthomonas gei TaxID=1383030 RepID=A0ABX0AEY7_9GAMM|nr:hypothetical protein [Pseudoxanthomonas gei]NDK38806.1 hypothetical protein [Pseudoxanthomonas gei]